MPHALRSGTDYEELARIRRGETTKGNQTHCRVPQQGHERLPLPRAAEGSRRRVRRVGGAPRLRRGIVAVAEREVGDGAFSDGAGVAEDPGPAIRLQRRQIWMLVGIAVGLLALLVGAVFLYR